MCLQSDLFNFNFLKSGSLLRVACTLLRAVAIGLQYCWRSSNSATIDKSAFDLISSALDAIEKNHKALYRRVQKQELQDFQLSLQLPYCIFHLNRLNYLHIT